MALAAGAVCAAHAATVTLPVAEVAQAPDPQTKTFPAKVLPVQRVDVTPEVSGDIIEVCFKDGALVKANDVLYRLLPIKYTSALKNAQAKVAECKAKKEFMDAAYERVRACAGTSPERYIEMLTRYFDTPEGLLKDRRWTLRIRRENDRQVLTCKTPGRDHSRGEWELIRTADAPVPTQEELQALVDSGAPEALCRLSSLKQVCGAGSFFELELELYSGNADRLAELARIAALPEEVLSKQARAMRLL